MSEQLIKTGGCGLLRGRGAECVEGGLLLAEGLDGRPVAGEGLPGEGERVRGREEGAGPGQRGGRHRGGLGLDPELGLVLVDGGVDHLCIITSVSMFTQPQA